MATPTTAAATAAAASPSNGAEPPKDKADQTPAAEAPKKLSNAELKAQKQAKKANRRAAAVAAKEANPGAGAAVPAQGAHTASDGKAGKPKSKQEQSGSSGGASTARPSVGRRPSAGAGQRPTGVTPEKQKEEDPRSGIPECFSHLPMAKRITLAQADKDVHPAILAIGQQMATFTLRDPMARAEATVQGFKQVIKSYKTPPGNAFSRHFVPHVLNPQIEYLAECRPMCFAMGNAIRLLKAKVAQLDVDTADQDANDFLCDAIDTFVQERITYAEVSVTKSGADRIIDGDTILTYGSHRLARKSIELALDAGKSFSVIVVDDPYDRTGRDLVKSLCQKSVAVSYFQQLRGLACHMERVSKVLLGVEAVFSDGSLYGASGTSDIAMAAANADVAVIALCESLGVDRDRVPTDNLTYNEIDPERCSADRFRLLFDAVPSKYVGAVLTEYEESRWGTPSEAVQAVLRAKDDMN